MRATLHRSGGWRRLRWIALAVALIALVVSIGVLCQARLRGGTSPEEVATRYVAAVRGGDRVTLFLLSHPDAALAAEHDARIERYRGVPAERIAIRYEPHAVAAYLMTVIVSVGGAPFDRLVLQAQGGRWYLIRLRD